MFPRRLTAWNDAQLKLKNFHGHIGNSLLESPLIDPALFVSPDNSFRTMLFMMWLRVQPVFLWRLSLPMRPKFYSNKDWRKMLEAADGLKLSSLKGQAEMLQELKDVVLDSRQYGIEIDANNLASTTVFWKGAPVLVLNNGMPESDVVRAAVWELYEINFRLELLLLDRELVPEPIGEDERTRQLRHEWLDHEMIVNQCWPGLLFRPDPMLSGLSSYDKSLDTFPKRIPFLKAFHNVHWLIIMLGPFSKYFKDLLHYHIIFELSSVSAGSQTTSNEDCPEVPNARKRKYDQFKEKAAKERPAHKKNTLGLGNWPTCLGELESTEENGHFLGNLKGIYFDLRAPQEMANS
ncbi:hypothetical protein C8R42DRAFT_640254 [Lentinula raphanica]|nr:hypothetical protein C8R42DRAFT_640254 [Lentinula raphanica]